MKFRHEWKHEINYLDFLAISLILVLHYQNVRGKMAGSTKNR